MAQHRAVAQSEVAKQHGGAASSKLRQEGWPEQTRRAAPRGLFDQSDKVSCAQRAVQSDQDAHLYSSSLGYFSLL